MATTTDHGTIVATSVSYPQYSLTDRHIIVSPDGDGGWYMVEDDCPPGSFESRCDFLAEEMRIMIAEFA